MLVLRWREKRKEYSVLPLPSGLVAVKLGALVNRLGGFRAPAGTATLAVKGELSRSK